MFGSKYDWFLVFRRGCGGEGVRSLMVREFLWRGGRLILGFVVICIVSFDGLVVLWQTDLVVEAAILDPHPGLVGWWRFDEGAGSLEEEGSGNGNHGIGL